MSCSFSLVVLAYGADAQTITLPDEYGKLLVATSQVDRLKVGLVGEQINLYSGALGIMQTDVSIPGSFVLPVEVTRRFSASQGNDGLHGFFADWDLAIPNIHGIFSSSDGWIVSTTTDTKYRRCSLFAPPPPSLSIKNSAIFESEEFWQGDFVFIPGRGDQEILVRSSSTPVPGDGGAYPLVLADGSAISCLSSLASGSNPSLGEGFEVTTPDGTKYQFDHMVTRVHSGLSKMELDPGTTLDSDGEYYEVMINRAEYMIFPTIVTDRFGNYVKYSWSSSNPLQLLEITSSDGRSIAFSYTDSTGYLIQSVTASGRTWTYTYGSNTLLQAELPDLTNWNFALSDVALKKPSYTGSTCDVAEGHADSVSGMVTTPGGASVTFNLALNRMTRTWVSRVCSADESYATYPKDMYVMALASKVITGPGLPSSGYVWSYSYDNLEGCWDPTTIYTGTTSSACTTSTAGTRTVTVTNPDGSMERSVYGNHVGLNEGQLLTQEFGVSGSSVLRTDAYAYAAPDAGPYPTYIGDSYQPRGDGEMSSRFRPRRQVTITQQGQTFTWSVASDCSDVPYCFDTYARATKIVMESSPSP
ncbi:MAG: hypothetical protein QM640_13060 [Niabella sp.]